MSTSSTPGTLRIGVVGYTDPTFDWDEATLMVEHGVGSAIMSNPGTTDVVIVSGLTNSGIPAIAYAVATANGYRTVGIACERAREYECFPVDEEVIVGSEWGDESETFLNSVDVVVRVGSGLQALIEASEFERRGGMVFAHELDFNVPDA